jgi:hypothetical protein
VSAYDTAIKGQGTDTIYVKWKPGHAGSSATIKVYVSAPCSDTATLSASVGISYPESLVSGIRIYPVPASDYFVISVSGTQQNVTADLLDITGRAVKSLFTRKAAGNYTINTAGIANGIYLVRITDEIGLTQIERIIINK